MNQGAKAKLQKEEAAKSKGGFVILGSIGGSIFAGG
jgi:hypothetical protein